MAGCFAVQTPIAGSRRSRDERLLQPPEWRCPNSLVFAEAPVGLRRGFTGALWKEVSTMQTHAIIEVVLTALTVLFG